MRRKLIVLAGSAFSLVFVLTLMAGAGDSSAPSSDSLVILHANVIDGISDAPLKGATVVVVNGHIQSIGHDTPQAAGAAQVLDLKGKWLLPGFVDAHAHIGDLASARRAVRSGTTTARDMGVNHFADIGIRELNHAGVSDVPDIVAAGYHVRLRPADECHQSGDVDVGTMLGGGETHGLDPRGLRSGFRDCGSQSAGRHSKRARRPHRDQQWQNCREPPQSVK